METQISFPFGDWFGCKQRVHFLEEIRRVHIDGFELGVAGVAIVGFPVECRRQLADFR